MPLEDELLSREPDGSFQEEYCKWCYTDGSFVYHDLEALTEFLVSSMSSEAWPSEQVRAYLNGLLPTLKHWKEK